MAVIVYLRKILEDEQKVRYEFGPEPEAMARALTFDKATRRSTPQDGRTDQEFLAASRKVTALLQERGTWPEKGMYVC
jgi:hypothetical protein